MRAFLLAMLTALGIGLVGNSSALAAPVNGAVLNELTTTEPMIEEVGARRSRRICIRWKVTRHHAQNSRWYTRRGCLFWRHF